MSVFSSLLLRTPVGLDYNPFTWPHFNFPIPKYSELQSVGGPGLQEILEDSAHNSHFPQLDNKLPGTAAGGVGGGACRASMSK